MHHIHICFEIANTYKPRQRIWTICVYESAQTKNPCIFSERHHRCRVPFRDGAITKEYAHAWPLPRAEIHFNDDQPFVAISWDAARDYISFVKAYRGRDPISLFKVNNKWISLKDVIIDGFVLLGSHSWNRTYIGPSSSQTEKFSDESSIRTIPHQTYSRDRYARQSGHSRPIR